MCFGIMQGSCSHLAQSNQSRFVFDSSSVCKFMSANIINSTSQGHELQTSTNILGPYLLARLLYPILKQTADASPVNSVRVCWASSLLMELSPHGGVIMNESGSPILSNNRYTNYFVSKAANNLLASEFGKQYKQANILSVVGDTSLHFSILFLL